MSNLPKRRVRVEFAPSVPVTPQIRYRGILYNLKRATLSKGGGITAVYTLP